MEFFNYFRTAFPSDTITPKLHMLEKHVVKFIKKWKIGLGMYSEQGAESIHPEFNSLLARFKCMPSDEKRIRSIFEEHHRKVRPEAKKLVPETKKRVFKAAREE